MKEKLFTDADINNNRQMGVDFAKFLSIIFMVAIHVFIYYCDEHDLGEGMRYVLNTILGGPLAAPVFMVCMGIGITYSRRNDARTMMKRGIKLYVAAICLNVLRSLPFLILFFMGKGEDYLNDFIHELMMIDILHFAGVAFLFMALLRKINVSAISMLIIGLGLSLFGNYINSIDTNNIFVNMILSPFIGIASDEIYTYFPFANWFIFVAAGYSIGKLLHRCTNTDRLFAIATPIATVLFFAQLFYYVDNRLGMYSNDDSMFYCMSTIDAIFCVAGAIMMIGVGHFVMKIIPKFFENEVIRISSDITRIYIVHWLIVIWIFSFLFVELMGIEISDNIVLLISIIILIISAIISRKKPVSSLKI